MSDIEIRIAAFNWLKVQAPSMNEILPYKLLTNGFSFKGEQIHLIGPQGIFKPKMCEFPLSITTTSDSPYEDSFPKYKYRGIDPDHRDNVGLRNAMKQKIPLIYFFGITKGKYLATWPVFITYDDPANLTFYIEADNIEMQLEKYQKDSITNFFFNEDAEIRRSYATNAAKRRLHQELFRVRVLRAYQEQCSFCKLKHEELLDAAHIIPDSEPKGEPLITNGIALCKLHHAAFDSHFIGIKPDYYLEVRKNILREPDGPMHQHGLKDMHGKKIILPDNSNYWPKKDLLELRYKKYLKAM